MKASRLSAIALSFCLLFLTACSDSPQPETEAKAEKAKPAEPVSGLTALYQMFNMARQWAPDAQVLRARSIRLAEVASVEGKSGAWEATFVSAAKGAGKTFTYSVVEAGGNLHQGVFGGVEEGYSVPRGQEQPFPINGVSVDTDKAYGIAMKKGDYYAKANPKVPVSFLLERTPAHNDPIWRVFWGESLATSGFSILVNAATGEFVQALR